MKNDMKGSLDAFKDLKRYAEAEASELGDLVIEARHKIASGFGPAKAMAREAIAIADELEDMMNQLSNYPPEDGDRPMIEGEVSGHALEGPKPDDAGIPVASFEGEADEAAEPKRRFQMPAPFKRG